MKCEGEVKERMERHIMTTATKWFFTLVVAAATATPLAAYNDQLTHPHITMYAVQKSVLYKDPLLMFNLGLPPVNRQLYTYRARVDGWTWLLPDIDYQVSSLIAEATYDEDQGTLALSHFFDPVLDRALTLRVYGEVGTKSWIWALNSGAMLSDGTFQWYSLADARYYLSQALTYDAGSPQEAEQHRVAAIGKVYLSLGHAVHHIQDMAQPQHTRNDVHIDSWFAGHFIPFLEYDPSLYETYAKEHDSVMDALAVTGSPVFPGSSDFKVAKDFWTNSNSTGIAQDTNHRFVSKGTNFTINNGQASASGYQFPQPLGSTEISVTDLFATEGVPVPIQVKTICGLQGADCMMAMYATETSARASTLSIFDQDFRAKGLTAKWFGGYTSTRLFSLNQFNFDDALPYLIPKAVSYSAGLINHFFRGKLDVTAPASGPYAVVDQSLGKGFTKVRVTVKNVTPGEALSDGNFQAIARFHRNNCYKDDLSGEFKTDDAGNLITPCDGYRSVDPEIRVTAEQAGTLGVDGSQEMTFTFTDPIPLNATDLIIQVYYRGTVGDQTNDFALGAVDVSEPTFIAMVNATDAFELNQTFYYYKDIIANITQPPYSIIDIDRNGQFNTPPDVNVRGGDINYEMKINGQKVGTATVGEGRFARVAALVSPLGLEVVLTTSGNIFNGVSTYNMPARVAQIDYDKNAFLVTPVSLQRSQSYQNDSVTFYQYWPVTSNSIKNMPPSQADEATKPLAVNITQ